MGSYVHSSQPSVNGEEEEEILEPSTHTTDSVLDMYTKMDNDR